MKTLGQLAYEEYGNARCWKTVSGGAMPTWDQQDLGISDAWEMSAAAVYAEATKIRPWRVSDDPLDVVGAATAEEAIAWYLAETGVDRDDLLEHAAEEAMGRMIFRDENRGPKITYAQAIREATSYPCLLSTTEF